MNYPGNGWCWLWNCLPAWRVLIRRDWIHNVNDSTQYFLLMNEATRFKEHVYTIDRADVHVRQWSRLGITQRISQSSLHQFDSNQSHGVFHYFYSPVWPSTVLNCSLYRRPSTYQWGWYRAMEACSVCPFRSPPCLITMVILQQKLLRASPPCENIFLLQSFETL